MDSIRAVVTTAVKAACMVPAMAIVAACTANVPQLETLPPPAEGAAEECPQELFGPAIIRAEPDRVGPVLATSPTGESIPLVWQRSFRATFSPLRIYDAEGELVASEGDTVWLTGGGAPDGRYYVCGVSRERPAGL